MEWVETKKGEAWYYFDTDGVAHGRIFYQNFFGIFQAYVTEVVDAEVISLEKAKAWVEKRFAEE